MKIRLQSINLIAFIRLSQWMEQAKQLQMIINQILATKGFYFLNYKTLGQILTLLGKTVTWNPTAIQELTMQGLMAFAQNQEKNAQRQFCQPKFESISAWTKEFLTSIIQQVISAKHRISRNASAQSIVRTIPDMNFPLLTYTGYTPQMGFINTANCLGQSMISHQPIHFPQQMQLGFGHFYNQNLVNNEVNDKSFIKGQEPKIEQNIEEQVPNEERFVEEVDNFQAQALNEQQSQKVIVAENNLGHKAWKIDFRLQYKHQKKQKKYLIIDEQQQMYQRSQHSQQYQKRSEHENKKITCSFQIQTDLTLMVNGLKIKKKFIKKQKKSSKINKEEHKEQVECQKSLSIQPQGLKCQIAPEPQQQEPKQQVENIQGCQQVLQNILQNMQAMEEMEEIVQKQQEEYIQVHQEKQHHQLHFQLKEYNIQENQHKVELSANNSQQIHHEEQQVSSFNQEIHLQSANVNQYIDHQQQKIELLELNQRNQEDINQFKFQKCVCNGKFYSINIFMCEKCHNNFHVQCLDKQHELIHNIECPICKIRQIDPFQKVKDVIGQFYVKDISQNKFSVQVNLSSYLHLLEKKENNKTPKQKTNDLEIRCLKLQKNYQRSEITWPDEVVIFANGHKVTQTYGLLLTSSTKKRVDQSIVITQHALTQKEFLMEQQTFQSVKIELEYKNLNAAQLSRKQIDNNHIYVFGVYYIQRIRVKDLYEDILANIAPFETNYIQNLFNYEIDKRQMQVNFMTCRLRDPYNGQLINLPVRGVNCTHPQCFDLKTFIYLIWNSKNQLWRCPVCSKEAKQFRFDEKQLQMIKKIQELKVIPEELIYLNKGDVLLKIQIDAQNNLVQNIETEYCDENQKGRKSKIINLELNQKENEEEGSQKTQTLYKYFEYFPDIQLLEVDFKQKQCFAARKIVKEKLLEQKQKQRKQRQSIKQIKESKPSKRGKKGKK